jgi:RNA polymerase sigma-70 factor (ECF subfamily)
MSKDLQTESGSTSRSLIRRAAANDPAAWQRLSHIYGPLVYQWCRHCGLQPDDAADIVQEVFRSLARSLDSFRREQPGDSFRAWLWTITRNKLRDHHRNRQRQPLAAGGSTAHEQLQQLPDLAPEDSDAGHRQQVRSELAQRALGLMQQDFEERTWQAFWKTAVEQQSAAQAAAELGLSVASIYMAKSRVLRRLREELDGLDLVE